MAAVEWEPRPGVRRVADPAHLRLAGAGAALTIGAAEAVVASLVFRVDALWAGAASVTLLGWWLGPLAMRRPASAAMAMAVLSVLFSALLISALLAAETPGSDVATLAAMPILVLIGLFFVGLPALVLTTPSSIAWLLVVRWLADHRATQA